MKNIQLLTALVLAPVLACGSTSAPPANTPADEGTPPVDAELRASLARSQRTEAERARDNYRHPRETLEFLGLRDDMNVIELAPGEGWYTAVLAPVLSLHGSLGVTIADPNGPPDSGQTRGAKALLARFATDPNALGRVHTLIVQWKEDPTLGPDASADMVVTFRNAHNWLGAKTFDKVLAATFKVLKPGGILGMTDHRANPVGRATRKRSATRAMSLRPISSSRSRPRASSSSASPRSTPIPRTRRTTRVESGHSPRPMC